MSCVYVLHLKGSNKIRYVGISSFDTPEKRFKEHLKNARGKNKNNNWPVYNWIRKHYDSVDFTLIEAGLTWEEACEREISLISKLKEKHNLLNCTEGGEGRLGAKHSIETRKKMSEIFKNNLTPERRLQLSKATKGRRLSEDHKSKISKGVKKSMTSEVRKKISESSKQRMTPERRAELSQAMSGRLVSENTREKHRAAALAQHARKKKEVKASE